MRVTDPRTATTCDDDFTCSSAGTIALLPETELPSGVSTGFIVPFKPEQIPVWFETLLEELFGGGGVPKEYMASVRISTHDDSGGSNDDNSNGRTVLLRFELSPKGKSYMHLPWFVRRNRNGWQQLPGAACQLYCEGCPVPSDSRAIDRVDITVALARDESVIVASAPYDTPEDIVTEAKHIANESHGLWRYREIGETVEGRPIPCLESQPRRDLRIVLDASMQSCEPVHLGIFHVAHWLSLPTIQVQKIMERVQFVLLPVTNPDGLAHGFSVTNAVVQVPKFGINDLNDPSPDARPAPNETVALWQLFQETQCQVSCEIHAHFTDPGFSRSVGMPNPRDLPTAAMRARARAIEAAFTSAYGAEGRDFEARKLQPAGPVFNRLVLLDTTTPEEDVYGSQHVAQLGQIVTWLQAVPASIDAHKADVREMAETLAVTLIAHADGQETPRYGPSVPCKL